MSDITAVPYRTPACDEHLPDNDSDECPWCRIAELENPVGVRIAPTCAKRNLEATITELRTVLQDFYDYGYNRGVCEASLKQEESDEGGGCETNSFL